MERRWKGSNLVINLDKSGSRQVNMDRNEENEGGDDGDVAMQIDENVNEEDSRAGVISDLINDSNDEGESDDDVGGKRRRNSDDEEDDLSDNLEDDDYDLLEENLGVKVQRKKFKRLRRVVDDDSDDEQGDREAIADQLFDDSDTEKDRDREESVGREVGPYASDESEDESDDGFIVDDQDRPIRGARKKTRPVFNDATLQAAQEVFGVDFDFEDLGGHYEEDDGDENDEDGGTRIKHAKSKGKSILDVIEPYELERAGITKEDFEVRNKDVPERYQFRRVPFTFAQEEKDVLPEAEWIYKIAFKHRAARRQAIYRPSVAQNSASVAVPPAPESEANWGDDWDKQTSAPTSSVVAARTSIPGPAATESGWGDNWDQESTVPTSTAAIPASVQRNASRNNDDEDWDTEPVTKQPDPVFAMPTKRPPKAIVSNSSSVPAPSANSSAGKNVEDESWDDDSTVDKTSVPIPAPSCSTVSATGKNNEGWGDDWDKQSEVQGLGKPNLVDELEDGEEVNWKRKKCGQTMNTEETPTDFAGSKLPEDEAEAKRQNDATDEYRKIMVPKIQNALFLIKKHLFEVPFIAAYRKEWIEPNLSIEDLWLIYRLDSRYCQLMSRKTRLITLFKKMQSFQRSQEEQMGETTGDPLRRIEDSDLERLEAVDNVDDLKDMQMFFSLHFAQDVEAMNQQEVTKKSEAEVVPATATEEYRELLEDTEVEAEPEPQQEELEREKTAGPGPKRKLGGGPYQLFQKAGIDKFVTIFGLSSEKFAENLKEKYLLHSVKQCPILPLDIAKTMCSDRLTTPEEVLKAAKFMMAKQISREPLVRRCVRQEFFARANLSCWPTKKGQPEIDENHDCYQMKYLKDKPVSTLEGDQFLRLISAEKDGLLQISLGEKATGVSTDSYLVEAKQLVQIDEFTQVVLDWNAVREECVEIAFEKFLYPDMRKEVYQKLVDDANQYVLKKCAEKLYSLINVAPYEVSYNVEGWSTKKGLNVVAIAYDTDVNVASSACSVNGAGELTGNVKLQGFTKNKKSQKEDDRKEKFDALRALRKFIRLKRPHVIVIGGESRDAVTLKNEVLELIEDMKMDEDEFPDIPVELLDNQPARVFALSQKAQSELGDVPILLKQAVSLARRLQDPLTEFAQLFNPEEEILCVRFHALQDRVPKEELLERLETEFVNVTNKVGVNLNKAVAVPHTSATLQFWCGFGPKKASGIIKCLKRLDKNLENRAQLIRECRMAPRIFINCSGFLKVYPTDFDSSESYIEPLDRTRVHPESYEWAKQIAVDSLGGTSVDSTAAVEEVMEHPELLREMNIDLFAEHLAQTDAGDKTTTLRDIVEELSKPFKEKRAQFTQPTPEQIFYMLSNETEETFNMGKLVTGVVYDFALKKVHPEEMDTLEPLRIEMNLWECAICNRRDFQEIHEVWKHYDTLSCPGKTVGIRVRLDNDVTGFVPAKRLSDKEVYNVRDRVQKGQMVHCRVTEIQHDRFSFVGTCRTSDLQDVNGEFKPPKDQFYDKEKEEEDLKKEKENDAKANQTLYMKRVIVHPAFRNISFQEVENLLDSMKPGDCIFRPSSKSHDHLTLTWKVVTGINQHVDIVELRKKNPFSLGETLKIGQDEFEDLDEIIQCYVNPMANFVKEICTYHYYVESIAGDRRKADEYLNDLKKKNPAKIHYVLSPSKEMPGKFMLSYLPNKHTTHEFATVTTEGYRFRQKVFSFLNQFINWFKDHFREPHVAGMIPRNAAISVPVNRAPRITPHYGLPNAYTPYGQSAHTTPQMTPAPPMSVVTMTNDDDWNEGGAGGGYNSSRRDDGNWNGGSGGSRSNDAFSTDGRSQAGWDRRDRDEDGRGGRGGRGRGGWGGDRGGRGGRGGDRGGRGGRGFGRGRGGGGDGWRGGRGGRGGGGRGGRDRDSWGGAGDGGGDSWNNPPSSTPFVAPVAIPDDDNWDDLPAKPAPARPAVVVPATNNDDNWDDDPAPAPPVRPSVAVPATNNDDNWDDDPAPAKPVPARPAVAVPATNNDDNWDDDPARVPAPRPVSQDNDDGWGGGSGGGGGYNSGRRNDGNWSGGSGGNRNNDAWSTDGGSQGGWDRRDRDGDRRGRGGRGRGGWGGDRGDRGGRGSDRGGRGGRGFGRGRGGGGEDGWRGGRGGRGRGGGDGWRGGRGGGGRGGRDRDSWGGGGGDSWNNPPSPTPFVAPVAIPDDDNWDDVPTSAVPVKNVPTPVTPAVAAPAANNDDDWDDVPTPSVPVKNVPTPVTPAVAAPAANIVDDWDDAPTPSVPVKNVPTPVTPAVAAPAANIVDDWDDAPTPAVAVTTPVVAAPATNNEDDWGDVPAAAPPLPLAPPARPVPLGIEGGWQPPAPTELFQNLPAAPLRDPRIPFAEVRIKEEYDDSWD